MARRRPVPRGDPPQEAGPRWANMATTTRGVTGVPRTAQDGERGPERARQVVRVGDVEELIRQLPGVIAARLVVNDWGGV